MIERAEPQDQLWNAASHVLGVTVTPGRPVRVRRGRMLAEAGALEFWHQNHDLDAEIDAELQARRRYQRRSARPILGAIYRRFRPQVKSALTSGGDLFLHRASGNGTMHLGRNGGDVTVFRLRDADVLLFAPAEVLAFSDSLEATDDDRIDDRLGAVLERLDVWAIRGTGDLATATSGEVVIVEVGGSAPVLVEAEALLAMTSGISLTPPDNYDAKMIERGVAQLIKLLPHNIDLGRRRVWLVAEGEGRIVIRSSD